LLGLEKKGRVSMRNLKGMALVIAVILAAASVCTAAPKELEPLAFLLGEWEASGGGKPGEGTGSATFALDLQDRVIIRTSYAEYPAASTAPAKQPRGNTGVESPLRRNSRGLNEPVRACLASVLKRRLDLGQERGDLLVEEYCTAPSLRSTSCVT
jgi:hypothetical protein